MKDRKESKNYAPNKSKKSRRINNWNKKWNQFWKKVKKVERNEMHWSLL